MASKLTYRTGDEPLKDHYFRAKDVITCWTIRPSIKLRLDHSPPALA